MHRFNEIAGRVRLTALWPICGLILGLTADPAFSRPPQSVTGTGQAMQRFYADRGGVSLDEAVSRVRRRTDGKILSAETVRVNGRPVHVIKVLTPDGRVRRVRIDASGHGG